MRRNRKIREFREKALARRTLAEIKQARMKKYKERAKQAKSQQMVSEPLSVRNKRVRSRFPKGSRPVIVPGAKPFPFQNFTPFGDYQYGGKRLNVCHVIESLGLGGAQTMMFELVNALNKYYGQHVNNHVVHVASQSPNLVKEMVRSYGIKHQTVTKRELKNYCISRNIDIVVQHRLAISRCLRPYMPNGVGYVLINHTWHALHSMKTFAMCDLYVSVCSFLHKKTRWLREVNNSRKFVILNGVENDYVSDIKAQELKGSFITGRCHRLVLSKFHEDSITWMDTTFSKAISGYQHYIIGSSHKAKALCKKSPTCKYMGAIYDREKKMSYIKAFDLYHYETFANEGASIAILEGLACGIPVLCHKYGGNPELIKHGVNGYVCRDRRQTGPLILRIASDPSELKRMRESTVKDFDTRLHVRHVACKYLQLFEVLVKTIS